MEQEGPSSGALYQPGREGRNTFPGSPEAGDSPAPIPEVEVLGTPLGAIEPQRLMAYCQSRSRRPGPFALDFTNTHIVAMRRRSREFRRLTGCFDGFLPDGMPLVWCMKRAAPAHRVYGPSFMGMCLELSAPGYRHFFLGGSEECLARLEARAAGANPGFRLAGSQHGYFPEEEAESIVDRINGLSPDFLWVGLGTPRQQQWIARWKSRILRGVILAVGFAFDVNAGTKPDAPPWMQRRGLGWLHRWKSEPRRLTGRYLCYNSLFLAYLLLDGLRGRAVRRVP